MLFVSDKISDDLIEVTDSYEKTTRLISVGDALTLGTKIYGLRSNGTVMVYSSVQKFLNMYRMRQALCNNLISYKIGYDTQLGLIIMHSCSLSDDVAHNLIIPDFVDIIGNGVFEKKLTLRSVVIPESVRRIGFACFRGCENLESVVIKGTSDSELDLDDFAFWNCKGLKSVHLREGIRTISVSCFHACTSLHELQLPNSLVQIGFLAFSGSGLETIKIPDSVTEIEGSAFTNCKNLRYAYISDAIRVIKKSCFEGCSNLEEVHLPKDLMAITSSAFTETKLKELWLPDTVEFVGSSDFTSPERLLSRLRISKVLLTEQELCVVFNGWYVDTVYLPEDLEELDLKYITGWRFKVIRFPKSVKLKNASVLRLNTSHYNSSGGCDLYKLSDFVDKIEVYEGSDAHIKLSVLKELKDKLEIIKS